MIATYTVEVGIAYGEPGGTWNTVTVEVDIGFDARESISDLETRLLQHAQSLAYESIDDRMLQHIAHVWLHHYEETNVE